VNEEILRQVKLLAIDVDGTLTRGEVLYSELGDELKIFNIADGLAITLCQHAGLLTAIVTGRESRAVERRAKELHVSMIFQGCRDKGKAIKEIREKHRITKEEIAFIGDDINDIPGFRESGVRFAVASGAAELKSQADYVTMLPGGDGAVREVIEMILRAQGKWESAVQSYLRQLEQAE